MLNPKYASRAAALEQRIQNTRLPLVKRALALELEGLHDASREDRFGAPPVARMRSGSPRLSPATMRLLPMSSSRTAAIITPQVMQANQITQQYVRAADQKLVNKGAAASRANVVAALQGRLDQLMEQRRLLGTFPMMYRATENGALDRKLADIRARMLRIRGGHIRDLMTEYRIIEMAIQDAASSIGGMRRVYDAHRSGRGMLTNKGVLLPDIPPSSGTAPEMIELTETQPEAKAGSDESTEVAHTEESWFSRNRTPLLIGSAVALAVGVYALRRRK